MPRYTDIKLSYRAPCAGTVLVQEWNVYYGVRGKGGITSHKEKELFREPQSKDYWALILGLRVCRRRYRRALGTPN